jgi:hypothetical protein
MKDIQAELKAPKNQYNNFGKYNYRSCEDIVEAAKPLLAERGFHLNLSDEMVEVGGRVYVKATASVKDGEKVVDYAHGWARETETKKGMDEAQITGAASSYARKYALNGLFAIDDTKDADTQDNSQHRARSDGEYISSPSSTPSDDDKPWFNDDDLDGMRAKFLAAIQSGERTQQEIVKNLRNTFKVSKKMAAEIEELGQ